MQFLVKFKNTFECTKDFFLYLWVLFKIELLKIRIKYWIILGSFMVVFNCKHYEAAILFAVLLLYFCVCVCQAFSIL